MEDIKQIENRGNEAVRQLRVDKLMSGAPFMINSEELPSTQCYLGYLDGRIAVKGLSRKRMDFYTIRYLSAEEAVALRRKYKLPELLHINLNSRVIYPPPSQSL
jgi:hypothetical protein